MNRVSQHLELEVQKYAPSFPSCSPRHLTAGKQETMAGIPNVFSTLQGVKITQTKFEYLLRNYRIFIFNHQKYDHIIFIQKVTPKF